MAQEGFKRKSTVLLNADVEDDRCPIDEAEKGTAHVLTAHTEAMSTRVPFRETDVGRASRPFW